MENIGFGLNITLIGMSLVFALLALLWGVLAALGRLDRGGPEVEDAPAEPAPPVTVRGEAPSLDADAMAAVAIAVLAHRSARRKQAAPAMRSSWPGSQMYASRWLAAGRTRQTLSWSRKR
jgi:glutaconyl-CoA/methylmalonyl-CoA decarboxylase subunit delta